MEMTMTITLFLLTLFISQAQTESKKKKKKWKYATFLLTLTEATKKEFICNLTKSSSCLIKLPGPWFPQKHQRWKTEGHVGWLFLSIRLSSSCSHLNPPPLSLCAISSLHIDIFAPTHWRCTHVSVCLYIWLEQLILPARKCPGARIWSWESVGCSVNMWHGAKSGTQPLSLA